MTDICGGRMTASQEQLDQWHAEHTESLRWLEPIYAEWERRRLNSIARINAEHLKAQEERRLREEAELTAWAVERAERIAWRNSPAGRAEAERERVAFRDRVRARRVEERAARVRRISGLLDGAKPVGAEGTTLGRDREIFRRASDGERRADLAAEFGLSRGFVGLICLLHSEVDEYRRQRIRRSVGRVIDMGGPRDVWLTWTPEMQAREFGIA
jgi:hypothetical protein